MEEALSIRRKSQTKELASRLEIPTNNRKQTPTV